MLFKQLEYFGAVVEHGNFYIAAEHIHISESAISQQIKKLEDELGVKLLERHNRTFSLTLAGELLYKKSLVIRSDVSQMLREVKKCGSTDSKALHLGYYKGYHSTEFSEAVSEFAEKYPSINIKVETGSHDELYHGLLDGHLDLILNDQRRAFSNAFHNLILSKSKTFVEISTRNPLSKLSSLEISDIKNLPCILIISTAGQDEERSYYDEYVGLHSQYIFVESIQEARLKIIAEGGYMPVDVIGDNVWFDTAVSRIPLLRNGETIEKNYCAFWKKENLGFYIEEFANILKSKF
ncbi:MAG: LysR family transcriptional regulator [Phascolarctobacterium sp.]|nr:LysR family transcriptional regulator [Phascolarctobacterium sp.]